MAGELQQGMEETVMSGREWPSLQPPSPFVSDTLYLKIINQEG